MNLIYKKKNITQNRIEIKPSKGWVSLNLRDLWEYRDTLYFLVWRDVKIRYKQTILGASWAIIQPFMTMVVFSIFFGRLAKIPSDGIPYPIFSYAALVPWTFFANGLTLSSNSLVSNANLLRKVYFPRLTIPMAAILAGVLDFIIAFLVLLVMMGYYRMIPTANIIWVPFFILLAFITALGTGLWFSALNVEYRDVKYTIPFLTQFWMFATPIAYPATLLSEPWRSIYSLNPMVGVIEGFRWALLGTDTEPGIMILYSSVVALLMLFTGIIYFRRMEQTFADIV